MLIPLLAYFLSFGLMLINKGIYWDDWVFYTLPQEKHIEILRQYGAPWRAYIDRVILSLPESGQIYHVCIFFSYLLALIFIYKIIKSFKDINGNSRIFLTTFAAVIPVNVLRIAFVTFSYALSYMLFYFAFWLVILYKKNNKYIYRLTSLLILFLSFTTFSLLLFYTIIIIYLYRTRIKESGRLFGLYRFFIYHLDYILLPVVFWVIKVIYFQPFGIYQGYNQISILGIFAGIMNSINAFRIIFYELIIICVNSIYLLVFLLGSVLLYQIFKRIFYLRITYSINSLKYFILGIFIFFLGVIPYYASGHLLSNNFWDNRHELLTPLGTSMIIYYGLQLLFHWNKINRNLQLYVYSSILILFINYNFITNGQYFKDWYKQKSIMYHMNNSPQFSSATTFIFKDNVKELNVLNRLYAFYEYTGIMKFVFKNEKRFALDIESYKDLGRSIPAKVEDVDSYYSTSEYTPIPAQYIIEINRGKYLIGWKNLFRLIWWENFDKKMFDKKISDIVAFTITKYDESSDDKIY